MNCLIVDDEPLLMRKLQRTVSEVLPQAAVHGFLTPDEALEFAKGERVDIAFLDIRMRGMDGLELAKALVEIYPQTNILFCTGHSEYALEAYDAFASDYLLKPITAERLKTALGRLRNPISPEKRLKIKCFGNFEAYCDGERIQFSLNKTTELLAYLVDRNGAECRVAEIIAALFENENNREYYKKIRQDLLQTFSALGLSDCLIITRGGLGIRRESAQCDYFDYKDGKIAAPPNEYMTQYSFGEITFAGMQK